MSQKDRIAASLHNGAEFLVIGEIALHTGLIVNQAPRYNANFDIVVNNHNLTKGCRVEVKHSRSQFKANISGNNYDILVFVYHPCEIIDNMVNYGEQKREIYVFPQSIVESTDKGETKTNFNPKHIENYQSYLNAYHYIIDKC